MADCRDAKGESHETSAACLDKTSLARQQPSGLRHRHDLGEIADYSERVADGEEEPDGECTKCGALSHEITKARAMVIAGITKPKRQRRRGGLK